MSKLTVQWIIAGVVLALVAAVMIVTMRPQYTTGTLYLNESDEPICAGQLKTVPHAYSSDTYVFQCHDGRVMQNLTNFIIK